MVKLTLWINDEESEKIISDVHDMICAGDDVITITFPFYNGPNATTRTINIAESEIETVVE